MKKNLTMDFLSFSFYSTVRPLHVEIEGPIDPLWSGKEVEFLCRSKGSRPPAKLKWGPEGILKILNYQVYTGYLCICFSIVLLFIGYNNGF